MIKEASKYNGIRNPKEDRVGEVTIFFLRCVAEMSTTLSSQSYVESVTDTERSEL